MVATKKTHNTFNDIAFDTRVEMISLLNQQLANSFDLYSQVKQAHWNVKGMNFIAVHELFDAVAGLVLGYVDMLAERVTALGGNAMGTARLAAQISELPEFPLDITGSEAFIKAVAERVAHFNAGARKAIDTADNAGDAVTADLFTEIARNLDTQLYFLESHIQG